MVRYVWFGTFGLVHLVWYIWFGRFGLELMKSAFGGKGEGLDKQKFTMLISEYRQYIAQNVNHISLNQAANSNAYSESSFKPYQISLIQSS